MTIRPALGRGTGIHWPVLGRMDIPCNGLGASFLVSIASACGALYHFGYLRFVMMRLLCLLAAISISLSMSAIVNAAISMTDLSNQGVQRERNHGIFAGCTISTSTKDISIKSMTGTCREHIFTNPRPDWLHRELDFCKLSVTRSGVDIYSCQIDGVFTHKKRILDGGATIVRDLVESRVYFDLGPRVSEAECRKYINSAVRERHQWDHSVLYSPSEVEQLVRKCVAGGVSTPKPEEDGPTLTRLTTIGIPGVPTDTEALKLGWAIINEHMQKCGNRFFFRHRAEYYYDLTLATAGKRYLFDDGDIVVELHGVKVKVENRNARLTAADRLNGLQWNGSIEMSAEAYRIYLPPNLRKWSGTQAVTDWKSGAVPFTISLTNYGGIWAADGRHSHIIREGLELLITYQPLFSSHGVGAISPVACESKPPQQ